MTVIRDSSADIGGKEQACYFANDSHNHATATCLIYRLHRLCCLHVCMSNQVLECLLIVTLLNELVDSLNLPPLELCKSCHWEDCRRLLQSQCSHSGKDEAETVVYMDQSQKEVFEIRCPLNYLRMQNKQYQFNHTLHGCMHLPKRNCNFPHSKVEEDIWNAWKKTASANVQSRTAVSWSCLLPFACTICACLQ